MGLIKDDFYNHGLFIWTAISAQTVYRSVSPWATVCSGESETRRAEDSGTHTSTSTKPPETIVAVVTV